MDDGHLLRLDDLLNGILLAGVEPGERESGQGAEGGLEWAYEGVAQADEALVGAAHGGGEGVEHDAVAGGVDTEAHAQETCLGMGAERLQGRTGGEGYGEGADIGLLDMALHGQFAKGAVVEEEEEGDGLAGLEIGVGLVVGDFVGEGQHQLVEGVVGTVAQGDGVAAVGLVDLGSEVGGGEGTGVCLTLVVHLHMQQLDQPLEGRNGVVIFHSAREITKKGKKYFSVFFVFMDKMCMFAKRHSIRDTYVRGCILISNIIVLIQKIKEFTHDKSKIAS